MHTYHILFLIAEISVVKYYSISFYLKSLPRYLDFLLSYSFRRKSVQLNFQIWSARKGVILGKGAQIVSASQILKSSMKIHTLPCYRKITPDEILSGRICNRHVKGPTQTIIWDCTGGFFWLVFLNHNLVLILRRKREIFISNRGVQCFASEQFMS